MIDVITEIAEDCRGFEYSLLGRNYGLLIRIYWEFLINFKWNMLLLIYCLYTKKNNQKCFLLRIRSLRPWQVLHGDNKRKHY